MHSVCLHLYTHTHRSVYHEQYEPLGQFLKSRSAGETPLRFDEVEAIIGAALPPAAGRHPAWWSNNPSNNVMTKVWLDAGYRTERVDLGARSVVFRRTSASPPAPSTPPAPLSDPKAKNVIDVLRRKLAGTVRTAPDFDLTQPTGERWDVEA